MVERPAHRARRIVGQPRGQLGDHAVEPFLPDALGALTQVIGVLTGRLTLLAQVPDAGAVVGELRGVGRGGALAIRPGPDERQPPGRQPGRVPAGGRALLPGAEAGQGAPGGVDLGRAVRGPASRVRGERVLCAGLRRHLAQRLQAAEPLAVVLFRGPEVSRDRRRGQPGGGRGSAGPGFSVARRGQLRHGPFGIIKDLGDLGGAPGRVEFPAYGGSLRLAGLQLIAAGQQGGAAALPVRQRAGAVFGRAGGVERVPGHPGRPGSLGVAGLRGRGEVPGPGDGQPGRRIPGGLLRRPPGGAGLPGVLTAGRVPGRVPGPGHAGDLGDARGQRDEGPVGFLHAVLGRAPPLRQPVLDGPEPAGTEQPLQQRAPLVRVGVQEPRELTLRQQHDLEELLGGHAHGVGDLVVGLFGPRRDRAPGAAGLLRQQDPGGLAGRPGPVHLGAHLLGAAGDAQVTAADRGLERHLGTPAGAGVVGAQPFRLVPLARDPPVQREPDRVEQGRLARAGLAVEQEQPRAGQFVEGDFRGPAERAERRDPQQVRPHQAVSPATVPRASSRAVPRASSRAAASSCRSPGVAGLLRTCATNSVATVRSSRPATLAR